MISRIRSEMLMSPASALKCSINATKDSSFDGAGVPPGISGRAGGRHLPQLYDYNVGRPGSMSPASALKCSINATKDSSFDAPLPISGIISAARRGDIRESVDNGRCTYNDNAILYRTNAQSRMFEEKFVTYR